MESLIKKAQKLIWAFLIMSNKNVSNISANIKFDASLVRHKKPYLLLKSPATARAKPSGFK